MYVYRGRDRKNASVYACLRLLNIRFFFQVFSNGRTKRVRGGEVAMCNPLSSLCFCFQQMFLAHNVISKEQFCPIPKHSDNVTWRNRHYRVITVWILFFFSFVSSESVTIPNRISVHNTPLSPSVSRSLCKHKTKTVRHRCPEHGRLTTTLLPSVMILNVKFLIDHQMKHSDFNAFHQNAVEWTPCGAYGLSRQPWYRNLLINRIGRWSPLPGLIGRLYDLF